MALSVPPPDPTLDPVTGLPVGADYFTQYQIPLNSQPVNLTELNAQGRQNNWLYPDHIPPTLARLQARDLTNEGNAQDLSTDGRRNLNVNLAASDLPSGGGGGPTPVKYRTAAGQTVGNLCAANDTVAFDDVTAASFIYGVTWWATIDPAATPFTGSVHYTVYLAPQAAISQHIFCGFGGWSVGGSGITSDLKGDSRTVLFPVPIDRELTWPGAVDIFLFLDAANAGIFCGGSALTG